MAALSFERLAVVDAAGSFRLVGIVGRSDFLTPVQHLFEEESQRERLLSKAPNVLRMSGNSPIIDIVALRK